MYCKNVRQTETDLVSHTDGLRERWTNLQKDIGINRERQKETETGRQKAEYRVRNRLLICYE